MQQRVKKDRRLQRSGNPTIALAFQLDASRADTGVAALVVADDTGLVLATAGNNEAAEEIVGRLAIGRDKEFEGKLLLGTKAWEVHMHRIMVQGAAVLVAAIGGTKRARALALGSMMMGTRRILGDAPAAA